MTLSEVRIMFLLYFVKYSLYQKLFLMKVVGLNEFYRLYYKLFFDSGLFLKIFK
jgi:hypothetical protein